MDIDALIHAINCVISRDRNVFIPPCGACRQVLSEVCIIVTMVMVIASWLVRQLLGLYVEG